MARRNAQAAPEVDSTETTEVEDSTTETTEAPVEATEADTTEAAPEKPIDLGPFQTAAAQAISEADASTGDLPEASIEAVNKVYREIDGIKGKNAARNWLDDQMKASIVGKDIMAARAYVQIKDGLSAGSTSGPKAPADPTQAFTQKVAALQLALVEVTNSVPEGVDESWSEKADELVASLSEDMDKFREWNASTDEDAEQPEVSPVVRQAFKLAAGRGSSGGGSRVSGGPRRDIEKHMIQVFDSLEAGSFLTVNEIAKAASTEYGDDRPSAGAVSARLFPKGKAPYSANGIEAVAEEGKSKGARKTA